MREVVDEVLNSLGKLSNYQDFFVHLRVPTLSRLVVVVVTIAGAAERRFNCLQPPDVDILKCKITRSNLVIRLLRYSPPVAQSTQRYNRGT